VAFNVVAGDTARVGGVATWRVADRVVLPMPVVVFVKLTTLV
jgi:hypothetical protein